MQQIQKSYDRDPSLYSADIDTLLGLRQSAVGIETLSSVCTIEQCTALKRYYAHLVRLTDKFPKLMEQQSVGLKESSDDIEITTAKEPKKPLIFKW